MAEYLQELAHTMITNFMGNFAFNILIQFFNIVAFPFYACGLYTLAKKKSIKSRWISFIPILNMYILGRIVGPIEIIKKRIPHVGIPLMIFAFLSKIKVPFIGAVTTTIYLLLFWITVYKLYEIYKPERAGIYTILGFVTDFLTPYFIFSIRHAEIRMDTSTNKDMLGEVAITKESHIKNTQCQCGMNINLEHNFCSMCGKKVI